MPSTPLISAIAAGDFDSIKRQLSEGVDPNALDSEGFLPLSEAIRLTAESKDSSKRASYLEVITLLIDKGANLSLKGRDKTEESDLYGKITRTPLNTAIFHFFVLAESHKPSVDGVSCLELLLSKGASPVERDDEVEYSNPSAIELLFKQDAFSFPSVVKLLLPYGAGIGSCFQGELGDSVRGDRRSDPLANFLPEKPFLLLGASVVEHTGDHLARKLEPSDFSNHQPQPYFALKDIPVTEREAVVKANLPALKTYYREDKSLVPPEWFKRYLNPRTAVQSGAEFWSTSESKTPGAKRQLASSDDFPGLPAKRAG